MINISWQDPLQINDRLLPAELVLERLAPQLTEARKQRIEQVLARRTRQVIPVLENIFDRGNISAVMRSAESFGFVEMHVVEFLNYRFKAANRVSAGTEKWLDVHEYKSAEESVGVLKARGYKIWASDLDTTTEISQIAVNQPVAIVFGNEKHGVSKEMRKHVDGFFRIPMFGFAQSFNISVAAALCFYHFHLKLREHTHLLSEEEKLILRANYFYRSVEHAEKYF